MLRHSPDEALFVPPSHRAESLSMLLSLWSDYGFRIFLRDFLNAPDGAPLSAFCRYADRDAVLGFLRKMISLDMADEIRSGVFRPLVGDRSSFGLTLEWFVHKNLEDHFAAPGVWSAQVEGVGDGDYDVLADLGGSLLYVEVTGAPPKHVSEEQIFSFVRRLEALQPDLAVYVNDTHLRMRDRLVVLMERALRRHRFLGLQRESLTRLEDECFHLGQVLYLTNTHRSIPVCLRRCIRHACPKIIAPLS